MSRRYEENLFFAAVAVLEREVDPRVLTEAMREWAASEDFDLPVFLEQRNALTPVARARIETQVSGLLQHSEGRSGVAMETPWPDLYPGDAETVPGPSGFNGDTPMLDTAVVEVPGRYRTLRPFAQGGMGRISLVRDEYLGREIALKELLPDGGGCAPEDSSAIRRTACTVARFLQEARITARLEHPSIVPVHELGYRADGTLYYTMKLVRGRPLSQAIREAKSLEERLGLLPHFVDVCQAIAYAHSRGVIHRDIKPQNVMIGEFAETVVIDWGLAKDQSESGTHGGEAGVPDTKWLLDGSGHTVFGEALGTPAYMSPEQARGHLDRIDERSDVYSLGAVLYEVLTGRQPFRGEDAGETLRRVMTEPPAPVLRLEPATPPELAAICERALQKTPVRRYTTARELADEVQRFLSGALVQSYSYRLDERLARLLRRHARLAVTVALAFLLVLGVSVYDYVRVRDRERAAQVARWHAEGARAQTEAALHETERARNAAEAAEAVALEAERGSRASLYRAYISLAQSHISDGRYQQARDLLRDAPEEFRHWEWGRLLFQCNQDFRTFAIGAGGVRPEAARMPAVTFASALDRVILQDGGGFLRMYGVHDGLLIRMRGADLGNHYQHALFSGNARSLAVLDNNVCMVYMPDMLVVQCEFPAYYHWHWSMDFSRDERRIAARQDPDSAAIVALEDGRTVGTVQALGLTRVVLDRAGARAALLVNAAGPRGGMRGEVSVWDVDRSALLFTLPDTPATHLGFARGGAWVLAAGDDGWVRAWDAATGAPDLAFTAHDSAITALALDEERGLLATGDATGFVRLWSWPDGEKLAVVCGHDGPVRALALEDGGALLASGGDDARVAVWTAPDLALRREFKGHAQPVLDVRFHGGRGLLMSASLRAVKFWRLDERGAAGLVALPGLAGAGYDPDSRSLLVADAYGRAARVTPETGGYQWVHDGPGEEEGESLVAPGLRQVLFKSAHRLLLWEPETGRQILNIPDRDYVSAPAAFDATGRRLAVMTAPAPGAAQLDVFDTETGGLVSRARPLMTRSPHDYLGAALAFDHLGRLAVIAGAQMTFFDPEAGMRVEGRPVASPGRTPGSLLVFAPDGSGRFAHTGPEGAVYLTGEDSSLELRGHSAPVTALAFTPDGARLFTGSRDGTVKVWAADTGGELLNWTDFEGPVRFAGYCTSCDALLAVDGAGVRVAHAFPWRDNALPGPANAPLQERVEAFKTYSPLTAPAWGLQQARLAAVSAAKYAAAERSGARTGDPPPPNLPDLGPEEGIVPGAFGELPSHPAWGVLHNNAHVLEMGERLERYAGYASPRLHHIASSEFRALLPADTHLFRRWMEPWDGGGYLLRAVMEMGAEARRRIEQGAAPPYLAYLDPVTGRAAMMLGEYDDAIDYFTSREDGALESHVLLCEAYLRRNAPGDAAAAATLLLSQYYSRLASDYETVLTLLHARLHMLEPDLRERVLDTIEGERVPWREMPWHDDLDEALAAARERGTKVYLEIGSVLGGESRTLHETIYSHPEIQRQLAETYALCFLEADHHPEIIDRCGVRALPALFILEPGGEVARSDMSAHLLDSFRYDVFPPEPRGRLAEWRILGPLPLPEGEAAGLEFLSGAAPGSTAEHTGPDGEAARWWTWRLDPFQERVLLEPWLGHGEQAVFLAHSRFGAAGGPASLDLAFTHAVTVQVNGREVLREGSPGILGNHKRVDVELREGENEVRLVHTTVGPHVNFDLTLHRGPGPLDTTPLPLPEAPLLSVSRLKARALARAEAPLPAGAPNETRVRMRKNDFLGDWRANHLTYLGLLNPRPVLQDGKVTGIAADNLSRIPLAHMLGLRDGDVILGVNELMLDSGLTLQEMAAQLQGLETYRVELLRDGQPHTLVIEVLYD